MSGAKLLGLSIYKRFLSTWRASGQHENPKLVNLFHSESQDNRHEILQTISRKMDMAD